MAESKQTTVNEVYKRGIPTLHRCKCGNTAIVKCTKRYKFENWRCKICAAVVIGEIASKKWESKDYREKWAKTRASTKGARSRMSKELWSDQARLNRLSDTIKKTWENPTYRAIKTTQSQQLWTDDKYQQKQAAGYTAEVRDKISASCKARWTDPVFREMMISIFRSPEYRDALLSKLRSPEYSALQTNLNFARWKNPIFRSQLMEVFGSEEFRQKMIGVNNEILSRPEVRDKLSRASSRFFASPEARLRLSESSKKIWLNSEYRQKMAIVRSNQLQISSLQIQLYKYLDDLGVIYYPEGEATAIGYYVFDCLIPRDNGTGILIECQGDYWHSFDKAKQNDRSKFTYIKRYFPQYEIMYLWEHEFGAQGRILDRLKLKLDIDIGTIDFDFSDVVLREPSTDELKCFLDSYHYIGRGRGGNVTGAYLGDQLIGCIVFSPPLRQNTAAQFDLVDGEVCELSRLCIHPSYHKKNFATWLISRALKTINTKLIIAYCDTTVGHVGTVYKAANFKFHHEVPSDYWYIDSAGYVMHKRTLYGKASKMSMAEAEYALEYGYHKVYGGQKLCFTYSQR